MAQRTRTDYIVIHCAATPPKADIGRKEIDQWHRDKGWAGIGYHYVIRRNGELEIGRAEDAVGAHVENHNSNSVAICMVGGIDTSGAPDNNFTREQWDTLPNIVARLRERYPNAKVLGHRDFKGVAKACPSFDVPTWAEANGFPTVSGKV